jgi:hypothetical protein
MCPPPPGPPCHHHVHVTTTRANTTCATTRITATRAAWLAAGRSASRPWRELGWRSPRPEPRNPRTPRSGRRQRRPSARLAELARPPSPAPQNLQHRSRSNPPRQHRSGTPKREKATTNRSFLYGEGELSEPDSPPPAPGPERRRGPHVESLDASSAWTGGGATRGISDGHPSGDFRKTELRHQSLIGSSFLFSTPPHWGDNRMSLQAQRRGGCCGLWRPWRSCGSSGASTGCGSGTWSGRWHHHHILRCVWTYRDHF